MADVADPTQDESASWKYSALFDAVCDLVDLSLECGSSCVFVDALFCPAEGPQAEQHVIAVASDGRGCSPDDVRGRTGGLLRGVIAVACGVLGLDTVVLARRPPEGEPDLVAFGHGGDTPMGEARVDVFGLGRDGSLEDPDRLPALRACLAQSCLGSEAELHAALRRMGPHAGILVLLSAGPGPGGDWVRRLDLETAADDVLQPAAPAGTLRALHAPRGRRSLLERLGALHEALACLTIHLRGHPVRRPLAPLRARPGDDAAVAAAHLRAVEALWPKSRRAVGALQVAGMTAQVLPQAAALGEPVVGAVIASGATPVAATVVTPGSAPGQAAGAPAAGQAVPVPVPPPPVVVASEVLPEGEADGEVATVVVSTVEIEDEPDGPESGPDGTGVTDVPVVTVEATPGAGAGAKRPREEDAAGGPPRAPM